MCYFRIWKSRSMNCKTVQLKYHLIHLAIITCNVPSMVSISSFHSYFLEFLHLPQLLNIKKHKTLPCFYLRYSNASGCSGELSLKLLCLKTSKDFVWTLERPEQSKCVPHSFFPQVARSLGKNQPFYSIARYTPERKPASFDETPFTFTIIMNYKHRGNCHDLPVNLSITSTENSNQPHTISDFCQILSMVVAAISSHRPAFDPEKDCFVICRISNSNWLESFPEAWHILKEVNSVHDVINLFVIMAGRCVIQTALVSAVECDGLHMLRNRYQARSESWVYETRRNRQFLPAASKEQELA